MTTSIHLQLGGQLRAQKFGIAPTDEDFDGAPMVQGSLDAAPIGQLLYLVKKFAVLQKEVWRIVFTT